MILKCLFQFENDLINICISYCFGLNQVEGVGHDDEKLGEGGVELSIEGRQDVNRGFE